MQFSGVVALLGVALPLLIPVGQFLYQRLLHALPANQAHMLDSLTQTVVQGVEQSHSGQPGEAKKAAAVALIEDGAKALHLSVNSSLVDALVESAVYMLNQAQASQGQQPQATRSALQASPATPATGSI